MKHVGLNVAADPLFTLSYTGVNGGLVIVVADDPGMNSSQNEQDSRFYARAALLPMLEPADSEECRTFVKEAFDLSERFDTPVLIRTTTAIAHARSMVNLEPRNEAEVKPYVKDASKHVMMPAMARGRHVKVEERSLALAAWSDSSPLNRIEMRGTEIGVVCSGVVYQYVREALPEASVLKLGVVNPLPKALIMDLASKVDKLYVIESLEPIFEEQIASWGVKIEGGKALTGLQGDLSARRIAQAMGRAMPEVLPTERLPGRPPVMCAGCPHRGPFYVLSKLKLHVTGDIGCYTLGALAPLNAVDTVLCMGASVGMAQGFARARGDEFASKTVAVIGDSTFLHSGVTALINAAYNKANAAVLILDNRTTGMTGHQPNPATGYNIHREPTTEIDLPALCRACGVESVVSVDAFDLQGVEAALKTALSFPGPAVVIARRACALLDKKRAFTPYRVNPDICTGCMSCMKLGCPAIEKDGKKARVNPDLCVGCGLCAGVCRFSAFRKGDEQ
jgi:indolepyruvate ferredoxin oxidoreductase alpha subunit